MDYEIVHFLLRQQSPYHPRIERFNVNLIDFIKVFVHARVIGREGGGDVLCGLDWDPELDELRELGKEGVQGGAVGVC